jgi:2'-5' RNA ligase
MRLFMAIDVAAEVAEKLAAVQRVLEGTRADVKWTEPGNYHVTVKFLGEVEETLVERVAERMERAAAQVPAFDLEVEGVEKFPERGPARVIVSRVLSPDMRMTKLHRLIDSGMGGMGLPMDTHVLVPHVTLGRVRTNHGLNRLLRKVERHDLDFFGQFTVSEVVLYHSVMGGGGVKYEALRRGRLRVTEKVLAEDTESTEKTRR